MNHNFYYQLNLRSRRAMEKKGYFPRNDLLNNLAKKTGKTPEQVLELLMEDHYRLMKQ